MYIFNRKFYDNMTTNNWGYIHYSNSLVDLIRNTIFGVISVKQDVTTTIFYWLYYYILEDVTSNLSLLYGYEIESDIFGFPIIQRNTRHAIEAYFDLFNYSKDPEYSQVIKRCNSDKYNKFKYKGIFTIPSKANIMKELYNENVEGLLKIAKNCNNYTHPNISSITLLYNLEEKRKLLSSIINSNFYILTRAFEILVEEFENEGISVLYDRKSYEYLSMKFNYLLVYEPLESI